MADNNQPIKLSKEDDEVPVALDQSTPLPRSYEQLFEASMPEKRSWPELEGLTGEEAAKKVKEEMPRAVVHVLPQGSFVTMDFRTNRVRIYVDASNKFVRAPMIG